MEMAEKEQKEVEVVDKETASGEGGSEKPKKPMYEEVPSPEEVLQQVLEKYDIEPDCIKHLVAKSKMRGEGGLHPLELHQRLEDLSSGFTGIKDKRLIPDIVEDYYYALEQAREKAAEKGMRFVMPMRPAPAGLERRRYVYHWPEEREYEYGYEERRYRRPYGYEEPPYYYRGRPLYEYPPEERPLTKADVTEIVEKALSAKAEKDKLDQILDKLGEVSTEVSKLKDRVALLEEGGKGERKPRGRGEGEKTESERYFEKRLEDLKEDIKERDKKIEDLTKKYEGVREELHKERYGKLEERIKHLEEEGGPSQFKEVELGKLGLKAAKQLGDRIERGAKIIAGVREKERRKEREETEESKASIEELPEEYVSEK